MSGDDVEKFPTLGVTFYSVPVSSINITVYELQRYFKNLRCWENLRW